ncbi:MAG: hypothetical protein ABSG45_05490 [Nitrososphaerales archaeon]
MQSKPKTIIASAVVISFLVLGMVPVLAQPNQQSQTNSANTMIQLAQAAQGYAGQVLSIAQQQGVNVTKAQSLIKQGDQLLSQAQTEVSTNSTQAARDALGAMDAFRGAAQSLQSEVVVSVGIENQVHYLQTAIQRLQNRTSQLQTTVKNLCSSKNASASTCSDANTNVGKASADIAQAASLLGSITSSSTEAQIDTISGLLNDAASHMQQVASDINTLADAMKDAKGVQYVQTVLTPWLTQLQQMVQKANLTSSQAQQIQGQLSQAKGLLGTAIQSFQSGNFDTGLQQATQAQQLMALVVHEIAQDTGH